MKRNLSVLLLLTMLATLAVSCGDDSDSEDTGASTTTSAVESTPENERLDLSPDLNFGGKKFTVISYEAYGNPSNEEDAPALRRALYMQIAKTEERLGIDYEIVKADPHTNVSSMVTQTINTQTDDYQLVFGAAAVVNGLVNSGYFNSIEDLPHVDMDKIWWNSEYAEAVALDANNPTVLFGDISFGTVERTCAVIFNKDLLLERRGMTDTELYDIVLDGEWTIDKFAELCDGFFQDNGNGNTNNDIEDTHAISFRHADEFNYMVYSAGLTFSERDEDGYPVLPEAPTERMIQLVDKLLPVFTGSDAFHTGGSAYQSNDYITVKFANGNALFVPSRLFLVSWIAEIEHDFGVIPMPKFDETIEGYHSTVGNNVIWGLVPTTVVDLEMSSAVAESLAYEGYQQVTPTYYEENLKLKYTRGDLDTESQILDLIRYGARTDFLYINTLGGLGNVFGDAYTAGSNNLASSYASRYNSATATLQQYIDALKD